MLKSWNELRKIDVLPYCDKRDNLDYLNWAKCIDLLHKNGAEKVNFIPLTNEKGSSLFMSDIEFEDKNGVKNRCYEVRIKVIIDDTEFEFHSPVMNGANPVKDNSMSQQRVWNAQTRAFVKAVAIHTGLGFDLWAKSEEKENVFEEDLSKHNIMKIKTRINEVITEKMKLGYSIEEISEKVGKTKDELEAILKTYFTTIYNLEGLLRQIK